MLDEFNVKMKTTKSAKQKYVMALADQMIKLKRNFLILLPVFQKDGLQFLLRYYLLQFFLPLNKLWFTQVSLGAINNALFC